MFSVPDRGLVLANHYLELLSGEADLIPHIVDRQTQRCRQRGGVNFSSFDNGFEDTQLRFIAYASGVSQGKYLEEITCRKALEIPQSVRRLHTVM